MRSGLRTVCWVQAHEEEEEEEEEEEGRCYVTLPGEPTGVHASEVHQAYVVLSWTPPTPRGRAPLCGLAGTEEWQRINTGVKVQSPRYPVFDLLDGKSYGSGHLRQPVRDQRGIGAFGARPEGGPVRGLVASRQPARVLNLPVWSHHLVTAHIVAACVQAPPCWRVPSAPGQVVATRNTKTSVFVQWDAPKAPNNLLGYYIDARPAGSKQWQSCNHKPFRHTSCDGASMTVTWSAPKNCGGSKVNAYYVDRRNADKLQWKEVNLSGIQERICTVANLTEGSFYEFKVQAANMAGVGVPSVPSAPMKCEAWTMAEPGPAYDLSFSEVRGDSLVILWKAPVYTGASAVSGYLVEMAKKGSGDFTVLNQDAVAQRYLQVSGLEEGESYVFRVRSVNANGVGQPSQLSEAVCAKALPGTQEIACGVDEQTGDVFLSLEACEISETSKFVWSKNYKEIGDCPRLTASAKGRTSRLTFNSPDKDDLGRYSVVVTDTDGVSASHTLTEDVQKVLVLLTNDLMGSPSAALNTMLELSHAIRNPIVPLKHGLNYEILEKGHVRFWLQATKLSSAASYRFIVNDKEVTSGEGQKISHDAKTGVIQMTVEHFTRANEGTYTVQIHDGKAKNQTSLVLVGDGPHFSEYLYFTVAEDCTVLLVCKVANVRKETKFNWYKDEEEIVLDAPPMSWKDTSLFEISGHVFDDIINAISQIAGSSASELVLQCTPEGIRLQCYMTYYTEEMKTVWKHKDSKIASSEKMRIGGTAEMAWMQICDPSDKEKAYTDAYEEYLRLKAAAFAEKNRGRVVGGLPDVVTIMEHKSLSLTCTVWGEPTPEVTWFKNEQEVASCEHTKITFEGGKFASLVITQVTSDDSGKYSINVRNKYGGEFVDITVSVYKHGEPIPEPKLGQSKAAATPAPASKSATPAPASKPATPTPPKSQTPAPSLKSPTPSMKSPTPSMKSPTPSMKSPTPASTPVPKSPTPTPKSPTPSRSVKSPTPPSRFLKSPTPK
ncbi:hypothetical protein CRUP_001084 [Coryphaenoides rupestris]|nr:hypothetical protein CRUP_001084 [Coryphaenoides rupestris]